MDGTVLNRAACLLTVSLLSLAPAALADSIPKGLQFQVNTYSTSGQVFPDVADLGAGSFVVVWTSDGSSGTDSSYTSIQGQRFESGGDPLDFEFQVNTYTTSYQDFPSVAAAADGSFAVVWTSSGSFGTDSSGGSIQGQRFAPDGSLVGGQFQVNTYTTSAQFQAEVASWPNGEFVVAWASFGSVGTDSSNGSVQGQLFASDGSPAGTQFQINTYTTDLQRRPALAVYPNGDFVVTWESRGSYGSDSSYFSIQGQRFLADGVPDGDEFQVNSYTTGSQAGSKVAIGSGAGFLVAWSSEGSAGTDSSSGSVQARRFTSDGTPLGSDFQVNTYTTGTQDWSDVATGSDGSFIVGWASDQTFPDSIRAQRLAADGLPISEEFQVNSYPSFHGPLSVGGAADGRFVVVWPSEESPGPDSLTLSVQGQRFTTQIFSDGFESGGTSAWAVTVP